VEASRVFGISTGGFERFFNAMGVPTDDPRRAPGPVHHTFSADAGGRREIRHGLPARLHVLTMAVDRVLRDVVYGEIVGFRPLTLDVHLPARTPAPVILYLHGGGWRLGSRKSFGPHLDAAATFDRIADAGFAVVSIDYRLSGEAKFPAQVDDARAALDWVRVRGAEHGLDGSRVVLWGESAGATIAALVAFETDSGVLGVVDWYGPSDLVAMAHGLSSEDAAATREAGWLGVSPLDDPALARSASPLYSVRSSVPPFHIEHGDADAAVPQAQSTALAAALTDAGVPVEFVSVPGANHMWAGVADPTPIVDRALEFARAVTSGNDHD
jgi:acetyl esterase/lipase